MSNVELEYRIKPISKDLYDKLKLLLDSYKWKNIYYTESRDLFTEKYRHTYVNDNYEKSIEKKLLSKDTIPLINNFTMNVSMVEEIPVKYKPREKIVYTRTKYRHTYDNYKWKFELTIVKDSNNQMTYELEMEYNPCYVRIRNLSIMHKNAIKQVNHLLHCASTNI